MIKRAVTDVQPIGEAGSRAIQQLLNNPGRMSEGERQRILMPLEDLFEQGIASDRDRLKVINGMGSLAAYF